MAFQKLKMFSTEKTLHWQFLLSGIAKAEVSDLFSTTLKFIVAMSLFKGCLVHPSLKVTLSHVRQPRKNPSFYSSTLYFLVNLFKMRMWGWSYSSVVAAHVQSTGSNPQEPQKNLKNENVLMNYTDKTETFNDILREQTILNEINWA